MTYSKDNVDYVEPRYTDEDMKRVEEKIRDEGISGIVAGLFDCHDKIVVAIHRFRDGKEYRTSFSLKDDSPKAIIDVVKSLKDWLAYRGFE